MAQRTDHVGGQHYNPTFMSQFRMESLAIAATSEMPIAATWPPVLLIDPNGGAKTVLLPPEAACKNQMFLVFNTADAAENLTLEEDSSTTAIVVLAQGESVWLHCDGVTWRASQSNI